MGAEGYLTMSRVSDGTHLLNLDTDPVFRITEPVVVLPAMSEAMGGWINLRFRPDELHDMVVYRNANVMPLYSQGEPVIGVCVLPKSWFGGMFEDLWTSWEADDDDRTPGGVPFDELQAAWGRIRPGFWAVTEYYECGSGRDAWFSYYPPKECVVDENVKWMFWT